MSGAAAAAWRRERVASGPELGRRPRGRGGLRFPPGGEGSIQAPRPGRRGGVQLWDPGHRGRGCRGTPARAPRGRPGVQPAGSPCSPAARPGRCGARSGVGHPWSCGSCDLLPAASLRPGVAQKLLPSRPDENAPSPLPQFESRRRHSGSRHALAVSLRSPALLSHPRTPRVCLPSPQ